VEVIQHHVRTADSRKDDTHASAVLAAASWSRTKFRLFFSRSQYYVLAIVGSREGVGSKARRPE
jgi:hypothetical protein